MEVGVATLVELELEDVEVVDGTEALVVEEVVLACDDELVLVVVVVIDAVEDGASVVEVVELGNDDVDDVGTLLDCTETVEVDELLPVLVVRIVDVDVLD